MKKIILPFFLVLLLIGCSIPDEIGLPSWTVPIRLVILNDTFDAEVIAEEVGSFQANGDTLQFYELISESFPHLHFNEIVEFDKQLEKNGGKLMCHSGTFGLFLGKESGANYGSTDPAHMINPSWSCCGLCRRGVGLKCHLMNQDLSKDLF